MSRKPVLNTILSIFSCIITVVPAVVVSDDTAEVYFADANLTADCIGTYSIVNRNCTGNDGDAYKTINRGKDVLNPGDTLLVRAGIYREQVTLETKGATGANKIKVAAYANEKVVINAADVLPSWIKCRSAAECEGNPNWQNIYYTVPGFPITQLFQHSKKLKPSRYPDEGWEYPVAASSNAQIEFKMPLTAKPDSYFNEAIAHVKTTPFWLSQVPVNQSYSDGRILLKNSIPAYKGRISPDFGYYFINIVEEINEQGEWAYDDSTGRLFLWPVNNLQNIEASKRDYGILIVDAKHYTIKGMTIKYPNYYGAWILGADHNRIENMIIEYPYKFGVKVQGGFSPRGVANYNQIVRNTILYSNHRGITNDDHSHNLLIKGNYVYATGAEVLGGDLTFGLGIGMFIEGENVEVLNNRIDRTGYTSIYLAGEQRSNKEIAYNVIRNSNLSLTDGAAIYSGGRSTSGKYDNIHHNIIIGVYGYLGGTKQFSHCDVSPGPTNCADSSQGIYIDEKGNNFRINDNTVIYSKFSGIYLHWAKNNVVNNNVLFANKYHIWLSGKNEPEHILEDNYLQNNVMYSTGPVQTTFFLGVNYDSAEFGGSNNNYLLNPYNVNHVRSLRLANRWYDEKISLADWRDLSNKELNSTTASDVYQTKNVNNSYQRDAKIFMNTSRYEKSINLPESHCEVNGTVVSNSLILQPYKSRVLLKCFCNNDGICNNNEDSTSCSADCS